MQRPLMSAWCTTTPFLRCNLLLAPCHVLRAQACFCERQRCQAKHRPKCALERKSPPGKEDFQGMKTLPCQAKSTYIRNVLRSPTLALCQTTSWQIAGEVTKNCVHFSICACHPCAGAMLIFSVSFQFYRIILNRNPKASLYPPLAGVAVASPCACHFFPENVWPCGVMASTLDSESSNRSSNLCRAFFAI